MGSILRATLLAAVVLGGSWLLLFVGGYLLSRLIRFDSGPLLVPMLAAWPLAFDLGIRQERLSGVVAWVAIGLGSLFLAVVLSMLLVGILVVMLMLP